MPQTASSILTVAPDNFATLLSESAAWQAACGVGSAAAALAFVHVAGWGKPSQNLARPQAIVTLPHNCEVGRGAYTSGRLWWMVALDVAVADASDHREASLAFGNVLGDVIEDVMIASEAAGKLAIRSIVLDQPPARSHPQRVGRRKQPAVVEDYFEASLWVHYGIRGGQ